MSDKAELPAWAAGRRVARDPDTSHGVPCPHCAGDSIVTDSRHRRGTIRRRRACTTCKWRFTTWEIISDKDPASVREMLHKQAAELRHLAAMFEKMAMSPIDDEPENAQS